MERGLMPGPLSRTTILVIVAGGACCAAAPERRGKQSASLTQGNVRIQALLCRVAMKERRGGTGMLSDEPGLRFAFHANFWHTQMIAQTNEGHQLHAFEEAAAQTEALVLEGFRVSEIVRRFSDFLCQQ